MLTGTRQQSLLLCLSAIAACLLLTATMYWPGLSGPFMLDDAPNIVDALPREDTWEAFKQAVTHNASGATAIVSRGVSAASFFLTSLQYDRDPWGYKYHNLLLHLLIGVLLFQFLRTIVPRLDRELDERSTLLVAGATATLWLLHPLLVSTVLYAVQRMTQLGMCFMLLALLAYLHARTARPAERLRFYLYGWLVMPAMAVLSVMSKETGVLLPLYLLVIELFVFRTTVAELRASRRLAIYLGVCILFPLVAGTALLALRFDTLVDYSARAFTLQDRLLTEAHALAFYLKLILLPRIREMSLFHDDFPVTTGLDAVTLLLLALLVVALAAAWRLRNSWPVVSFAIAWFLVSHALESTFLPLELVFEHRNYFAAAAVLLLPAWAVFRLAPLKPLRLVLPLIAAMFAFMTTTRAAEWGDYNLFHRIAVEEHPRSPRALNVYINYLMQTGAYDEAVRRLAQLREITPDEPGVAVHMQVLQCAAGKRDDAALARARELLAQFPVSVYAHNALQSLANLVVEKHCPELEVGEVSALVDIALESETARERVRSRSYLLRLHGILALAGGDYVQGYSDFRTAHAETGDVSMLAELLKYQVENGRLGDAAETLALIEQENAALLGIEQYQVDRARGLLEAARQMQQVERLQQPE